MSKNNQPNSYKDRIAAEKALAAEAAAAFARVIDHVGPTALNRYYALALESEAEGDEGIAIRLKPKEDRPSIGLSIRAESIDFSIGAEGPYLIEMSRIEMESGNTPWTPTPIK